MSIKELEESNPILENFEKQARELAYGPPPKAGEYVIGGTTAE